MADEQKRVPDKNRGLTSFHLKVIAAAAMLLDHVGVVFLEAPLEAAGYSLLANMLAGTPLFGQAVAYTVLRLIGRIAFPIYAFMIAEGMRHTRNKRRYQTRLLIGALVSEIPFDLAMHGMPFDWSGQNVFWTLLLGALAIDGFTREWNREWLRYLWPVVAAALAQLMAADYGAYGILVICLFHVAGGDRQRRAALLVVPLAFQATAPLALLPIHVYNGGKGPSTRWPFYAFYPAHLLALFLIRIAL